jgi:hypothetical protein
MIRIEGVGVAVCDVKRKSWAIPEMGNGNWGVYERSRIMNGINV